MTFSFLSSHENSTLFLINPWKFHPQPPPPLYGSFWNNLMIGVKMVYTLGNFCWYLVCSSQVLNFQMFSIILSCFWVVFWLELSKILSILFVQWWHARWCMRYATVFIEILRNGRNWVKKQIFSSFWVFLFMLSVYALWVMPQYFANLKKLLRYSSVVSFISTGHVVVKFKVFCIDWAPMKWLLFGVF